MSFGRPKGPKGPARGKSSRTLLCSGIAKAISFSQRVLATWTFLLIFGWCGPSSVSHSLISEHLTSGRTFLSLNPKINRLQAVSFNGAGFSLILPLYAWSSRSIPLQRQFSANGETAPLKNPTQGRLFSGHCARLFERNAGIYYLK